MMQEIRGPAPESNDIGATERSPELVRLIGNNIDALEDFSEDPLEKDPRIDAYRRTLIGMLKNGHMAATESINTIESINRHPSRSDRPMIYTTNIYLRYLQYKLMNMKAEGIERVAGFKYPDEFLGEPAWRAAIEYVERTEESSTELMIFAGFGIQSNVADRYKSLKIALNAMSERFGNQPRILDVGCSQNIGLKIVASNEPFFSQTNVLDSDGSKLFPDDPRAAFVASQLSRKAPFGYGEGVDIISPSDEKIKQWIKSNSFYPSELMDPKRVKHYDRLANYKSDKIGFIYADFSDPESLSDSSRFKSGLPGPGSLDVIVMSTVAYQWSKQVLRTAEDTALTILKDDGILLVQDFAVVDRDNPFELDFSPWHKRTSQAAEQDEFPYKTYVFDKKEPAAGYQNFLQWDSGRCVNVKLGPYALKLIEETV